MLAGTDMFDSVTYEMQYVGRIPIRVSIKTLDFATRTSMIRECMHRVCEDVKLRVPTMRPNAVKVANYIGDATDMHRALQSVRLHISLNGIVVEDFQTGSVLFHHRLPFVSFASSGDTDMMEFVSFVAKNEFADTRQCYVFKCTAIMAQDFINSIGRAFSVGYQGFKQGAYQPDTNGDLTFVRQTDFDQFEPPNMPPMSHAFSGDAAAHGNSAIVPPHSQAFFDLRSDESSFLLENEHTNEAWQPSPAPTHFISSVTPPQSHSIQDQKSRFHAPTPAEVKAKPPVRSLEPVGEPWYLGNLSRHEAERLLKRNGDFLVRCSSNQNQFNQFILSGLYSGRVRHLLLVNPEGQVRTRDKVFGSIQELIDYHLRNGSPIRSSDSELKLVFPVSRRD